MKAKQRTLARRLMLFLFVVLFLQLAASSFIFIQGGVLTASERGAYKTLSSLTANRSFSLSNEMLGRWGQLSHTQEEVLRLTREVLEENQTTAEALSTDSALAQTVVERCAESVLNLLRQNGVTDAYLILDAPGNQSAHSGRAGFSVRDYDPQSYTAQNTDLLMECGLPTLARSHALPLDSGWDALFELLTDVPSSDFFYRPLEQARTQPSHASNSALWSYTPDFFHKDVLTCSIPLVLEDGEVIGVLGVGILNEYLSGVLHYEELGTVRQGSYFFGYTTDGSETYRPVGTAGPVYSAFFRAGEPLSGQPATQEGFYTFPSTLKEGTTLCGAVRPLSFPSDTAAPDDGTEWVLIGLMEENQLLAPVHTLTKLIVFAVVCSFLIGLVLVFLASNAITKPITKLVQSLHGSNPYTPIELPVTHIREIDVLSSAIEHQNRAAVEAASRNAEIIAMTGLPIGVFDYLDGSDTVFVSRGFFTVLGWEDAPEGTGDALLPYPRFKQWQAEADQNYLIDPIGRIYRLSIRGQERYVQLFYRQEGDRMLGAYLDVTHDMEEKLKIEYERDYDVLTNILNRRAFDLRVEALFQQPELLKTAALIMFDLDNLKYANDTYGHDGGDRYLQAFARGLSAFACVPSYIARRSGDEFTVFLYGFDSQDAIRDLINQAGQSLSDVTVSFPHHAKLRVRASGGIAWYPAHATNYQELLRMADFAMYDIKRTVKGVIREFDPAEYREHGILIHGQDALNRLIDERMVRYAFQPIVSAVDGSLYGYELLMRPQIPELAELADLFKVAQAQSKLYQIEYLTWFESLSTCAHFAQRKQLSPDARIFINSMGNQCLTTRDVTRLEQRFPEFLSRLVLEITEADEVSMKFIQFKRDFIDRWNSLLALDDYGTGFNGESVLMQTNPQIVKLDLLIVRGVDQDTDRQALVSNLVSFAARRNIKVVAEGVETSEELATLVGLGVDYLQGYYITRPGFEPQTIPEEVAAEISSCYNATHKKSPYDGKKWY